MIGVAGLSHATVERYFVALGRRYRPRAEPIVLADPSRADAD